MERPPRPSDDGIFAGGLGWDIAYQGILITVITLVSYIIGHCMEVGYFEMPKGGSDDGMTMVVVTHEMGFAREVATRVLFMDGGNIVEQNEPHQFFANPQNARLKDFLSKVL